MLCRLVVEVLCRLVVEVVKRFFWMGDDLIGYGRNTCTSDYAAWVFVEGWLYRFGSNS